MVRLSFPRPQRGGDEARGSTKARSEELFEQAKQAGVEVYRRKGYTNFAIAQATSLMIETILTDARPHASHSCVARQLYQRERVL
ncbi:MAG: hypothetical protein R3B96_15565 [Pirellulaceae bacterium]